MTPHVPDELSKVERIKELFEFENMCKSRPILVFPKFAEEFVSKHQRFQLEARRVMLYKRSSFLKLVDLFT